MNSNLGNTAQSSRYEDDESGDIMIRNSGFSGSTGTGRSRWTTTSGRIELDATGLNRTPSSQKAKYNVMGSTLKTPQTSRSNIDTSLVIVAVVCGRGKAKSEIGMAWLDLRYPELMLSQFADTSGYARLRSKLQAVSPVEVVMPASAIGKQGHMTALLHLLSSDLPDSRMITVDRKYFNEGKGQQFINVLRVRECSELHKDLFEKYYCLASACALIKYVQFIQHTSFAFESLKITYHGIKDTCMIDPLTVKHLELIVSVRDIRNTNASMYGVMNGTFSLCASRLMRCNLLQPLTDVNMINKRLDVVDELLHNEMGFNDLRAHVSRMTDVDQFITLCVNMPKFETVKTIEGKLSQVIYLKNTLLMVDQLKHVLRQFKSPLLKQFYENMSDERYKKIIDYIDEVIDEDVQVQKGALNMRFQKCFAIRPGMNGLLDVARRTYTELMNDVEECVAEASEESGLPFRIGFTCNRGFYMHLQVKDIGNRRAARPLADLVPDWCLNAHARKNTLSCTTRTLIRLNDRITDCVNEIYMIGNGIIMTLLTNIREHVASLYSLSDTYATLDLLLSFAQFSSLSPGTVVRPVFGQVQAIKQGRHPVLERFADHEITPNDTFSSADNSFAIITGPNMAGKSTYLKQIALLQIMAQMGCYVPAEYAYFRVCQQIMSRISHNDDFQNRSSAFMVEMKDMTYICNQVNEQTLVIIDELGRSTSVEEGVAMCHAICEHLIKTKASVFLATHFLDLSGLESLYPSVECYHFGQQVERGPDGQEHYVSKHKLLKGRYNGPLYGFELTNLSAMPARMVDRARQLANSLYQEKKNRQSICADAMREKAIMRFGQRLLQAVKHRGTPGIADHLLALKQRFVKDLEQADLVADADAANRRGTDNDGVDDRPSTSAQ